METLMQAFGISCAVQVVHSLEEIFMHFEKRWPLWKMSRATFVLFEVLFTVLFLSVFLLKPSFVDTVAKAFLLLMFANGIWHVFWAWSEKRYVPGLVTAPLHIIIAIWYFV